MRKKSFWKVLKYIILLLGGVIFFLPYWFMVVISFETPQEASAIPPHWLPPNPTLRNYVRLFTQLRFGTYMLNSVIVTASLVVGQILLCSLAGYAFARLYFPGKSVFFFALLVVLMVPGIILLIPRYIVLKYFGLTNTLTGVILFQLLSAFGIFLYRQQIMSMPIELEEAAVCDGANVIQVFYRVVFPLLQSVHTSFGLLVFIYGWNLFLWPLIVLSSSKKYTLPVGLAQLQGRYFFDFGMMMAGAVVATIPVIVLLLVFQKQIIRSMAYSGLKQ
ncbi:carbohydrate ABC transporter permease [Pseudothermotoga sp.]